MLGCVHGCSLAAANGQIHFIFSLYLYFMVLEIEASVCSMVDKYSITELLLPHQTLQMDRIYVVLGNSRGKSRSKGRSSLVTFFFFLPFVLWLQDRSQLLNIIYFTLPTCSVFSNNISGDLEVFSGYQIGYLANTQGHALFFFCEKAEVIESIENVSGRMQFS